LVDVPVKRLGFVCSCFSPAHVDEVPMAITRPPFLGVFSIASEQVRTTVKPLKAKDPLGCGYAMV
jgi:hypothetical protein